MFKVKKKLNVKWILPGQTDRQTDRQTVWHAIFCNIQTISNIQKKRIVWVSERKIEQIIFKQRQRSSVSLFRSSLVHFRPILPKKIWGCVSSEGYKRDHSMNTYFWILIVPPCTWEWAKWVGQWMEQAYKTGCWWMRRMSGASERTERATEWPVTNAP